MVISATALTWPVFSATRAITAGSTSRTKARLNDGRCQPTTWFARSVCGGNPNQGADETLSQLTRRWVVTWPAAASYDVIGPKPRSKIHERA